MSNSFFSARSSLAARSCCTCSCSNHSPPPPPPPPPPRTFPILRSAHPATALGVYLTFAAGCAWFVYWAAYLPGVKKLQPTLHPIQDEKA